MILCIGIKHIKILAKRDIALLLIFNTSVAPFFSQIIRGSSIHNVEKYKNLHIIVNINIPIQNITHKHIHIYDWQIL